DHVSMGMVAATKFRRVVQNASRVVAIEMLAAAQGIEFRRPLKSSALIEEAHKRLRAISAPLDGDRSLSDDIEKVASMIARGEFSDLVED
ncbi:MAG: aromatic amino acid lyase, partial [Chthonomonas sp.]|nr:aromatic amino acid lyase [Chthonomonas sp.]